MSAEPTQPAMASVIALDPAGFRAAQRRLAKDPLEAAAIIEEDRKRALEEVIVERAQARWDAYVRTRPEAYAPASYARLKSLQNPRERVSQWWASGTKTLLLAGNPGRGKTDAGYAICNEVAAEQLRNPSNARLDVRAIRIAELRELLVMPLGAHMVKDEQSAAVRARTISAVRTAHLLLIDDLTAAAITEAFRQAMHALIDYRVSAGLRTIFTMNAPDQGALKDVLDSSLGAAIVSRIRDDAVAVWVDGEDMRTFSKWDPFAT